MWRLETQTSTLLPKIGRREGVVSKMTITWQNNVLYDNETNRVIFKRMQNNRSKVELYMDYLEELYPEMSYVEIAKLAIPELNELEHLDKLRFYSL